MSMSARLDALDHRQDDILGQLGGVGRAADFMARVTERVTNMMRLPSCGSCKAYARPSSAAKRF